jgi:orotate phosphoribosyltransferase
MVIPLLPNAYYGVHSRLDPIPTFTKQGVVNEEVIQRVFEVIERDTTCTKFCVDFKHISYINSRALRPLRNLTKEGVYPCNLDLSLLKQAKNELDGTPICQNMLANFNSNEYCKLAKETAAIYLSDKITHSDISSAEDAPYYLDSSNVYLSKYVNIKKLFNDPDGFKLFIYELALRIYENDKYTNADGHAFDFLVASSRCGAAIAACLSPMIDKPYIFFNTVGPKYAIENAHTLSKATENRRYLYIYDFICLGTEYRLTKSIIEAHGGRLIGGVGVASYATPEVEIYCRNTKSESFQKSIDICSVVYIERDKGDYTISADYPVKSKGC